jgi:hypothetical protein
MGAKLARLTATSWPAGIADDVVSIITGPIERPVTELSARLRLAA